MRFKNNYAKKFLPMNKCLTTFIALFMFTSYKAQSQPDMQKIVIHFKHVANGKSLHPDSVYQNPLGETYSVKKLKYYLSNLGFNKQVNTNISLIDAFATDSIKIMLPYPAKKGTFNFQLGVDSIYNCSGAQEGVLDPLNGMFWTWNTGYINFKLEGQSDYATTKTKHFEYHIGGYTGKNKTMRQIRLPYAGTDRTTQLYILVNLDNFWKGQSDIKISTTPVINSPGAIAKSAADNFSGLFSIIQQ